MVTVFDIFYHDITLIFCCVSFTVCLHFKQPKLKQTIKEPTRATKFDPVKEFTKNERIRQAPAKKRPALNRPDQIFQPKRIKIMFDRPEDVKQYFHSTLTTIKLNNQVDFLDRKIKSGNPPKGLTIPEIVSKTKPFFNQDRKEESEKVFQDASLKLTLPYSYNTYKKYGPHLMIVDSEGNKLLLRITISLNTATYY